MFFFPRRLSPAALVVVVNLLPERLNLAIQLSYFGLVIYFFVVLMPGAWISVVSVAVVAALFAAGYADYVAVILRALPALVVLPATCFTNSTHSGITSSL